MGGPLLHISAVAAFGNAIYWGPRLSPKRFLIGTEATETLAAWEENFAGRYWRLGEERQPLSAWHQNSDGDIIARATGNEFGCV